MDHSDPWPTDDWFDALAAGDPDVEREFWDTYADPLRRVASRQISSALAKRVDPDDIVQSACRTFFRRVRQGEFQCDDSGDLWRLLLTITLNKARMQARYHGRARRELSREQPMEFDPPARSLGVEEAVNQLDFADFLESVFEKLDEEQREILSRLLEEESEKEIAAALQCSTRTVRRMKSRIREILEDILKGQLHADG